MSFGNQFWLFLEGRWEEVSKEEYVRAERGAGFRNTLGKPDEPATAAFSGNGQEGTTLNPLKEEEPDDVRVQGLPERSP